LYNLRFGLLSLFLFQIQMLTYKYTLLAETGTTKKKHRSRPVFEFGGRLKLIVSLRILNQIGNVRI